MSELVKGRLATLCYLEYPVKYYAPLPLGAPRRLELELRACHAHSTRFETWCRALYSTGRAILDKR